MESFNNKFGASKVNIVVHRSSASGEMESEHLKSTILELLDIDSGHVQDYIVSAMDIDKI